jgi:amino acid transporter
MSFWEGARSVNPAAWVTIFLFLIISINMFGVKGYGEAEFVFCEYLNAVSRLQR